MIGQTSAGTEPRTPRNPYVVQNLRVWDGWADHQAESEFYDLAGFRAGNNHLRPYELEEVGKVEGKKLLHLQCRFGTDSLSWARLGADVTGVDFAPSAIEVARRLAADTGLDARFLAGDVYDLRPMESGGFDIVYTSRGVLCWLPDLDTWAEIIAEQLKPGGVFYLTEIHPVARMYEDEDGVSGLSLKYDYFGADRPLAFEADLGASYATGDGSGANSPTDSITEPVKEPTTEPIYGWTHSMGAIVTALASAGLRLEFLHEFPYCDWQLSFLHQTAENQWRRRPEIPVDIPLFFSLKASKPATP
ncbi:MAG: class I SAM-dependent methyltransferase [Catenulispora sp.]|nr:class I SAM-dependent methyltransferase [Catenulispora sp.]